jgi:F0F1-type ATP synthase assembly protein I
VTTYLVFVWINGLMLGFCVGVFVIRKKAQSEIDRILGKKGK